MGGTSVRQEGKELEPLLLDGQLGTKRRKNLKQIPLDCFHLERLLSRLLFTGGLKYIYRVNLKYALIPSSQTIGYFHLPRLTKSESDAVLQDVKADINSNGVWTPSKLVQALDKQIVSQQKAKRIIAQAIRNKYRMRKVEAGDLRDAMRPSNILVHGRSGSGKTEIFRLIAKLYNAPFIRVEATRYTEVGFHGDDITNVIVDLYKKSKTSLFIGSSC